MIYGSTLENIKKGEMIEKAKNEEKSSKKF